MLVVRVLGAAAGGGFPQWNANSAANRRARSGDPAAPAATQASVAVSADGDRWFVVNASPDLRAQIEANPCLTPQEGGALRSSPIAGVVLTNGDVDAIAGLLHLREGTPFSLYAPAAVLAILAANPVFEVVRPDIVPRRTLTPERWQPLLTPASEPTGLEIRPFAVPGKVPLYLEEDRSAAAPAAASGDHTIGLEIRAGPDRLFYVANCAAVDAPLEARLRSAPLVFMDGTLWQDDEMIVAGVGEKTGRRMGHISMSGPDGAMAALARLGIGRTIFIHINNTNPVLLADSDERRALEAAGFEIAHDGMEVRS
jgi:pyrroloquinoline quinone biosynthesis protein B